MEMIKADQVNFGKGFLRIYPNNIGSLFTIGGKMPIGGSFGNRIDAFRSNTNTNVYKVRNVQNSRKYSNMQNQ